MFKFCFHQEKHILIQYLTLSQTQKEQIMKRFFTVFMVTIFVFGLANAQQKAVKGFHWQKADQPEFVAGPWIESSNSVNESFEGATFPPAGWAKLNPDGGTGWTTHTYGTTPSGWTGPATTAPSATAGLKSANCTWNTGGAVGNDQWLVTPQILNVQPGDQLKFWIGAYATYADLVEVKISTTDNNNPASFSTAVASIVPTQGWTYKTYDIGALVTAGSNIYIGFREYVADNMVDGDAIMLDEVSAGGDPIPVEFASFRASTVGTTVNLNWSTATETNNRGFQVERSAGATPFVAVGFVEGKGTSTSINEYSFTDANLATGSYTYRLRQMDYDGTYSFSDPVVVEVANPTEFSLSQNYPNPFNPSTLINFSLATDAKVVLSVYNVLGQEVATLVNGTLGAGMHSVNFDASMLNSGLYIAKINASGVNGQSFVSSIKMMLNK
ncbi:MAG: hypothetical protein B6D45_12525 [Ignavibacteriales bacterium UTCHB3]|nr:MAG: hypothetical protein B6D45_12525 [Ignavibacteriales bacterium UTCHB3]